MGYSQGETSTPLQSSQSAEILQMAPNRVRIDLFSFFKIIPISNKMDNYNYNNTETLVEYLLGAKNSAKSR